MRTKTFLFIAILGAFFSVSAQQTISGTFSPAKDYTWLIAYHLKPDTQVYVADTAVEDGKFTLKLPLDAPKGMYRLAYAVPQNRFYFDLLLDGKETIELAFDTTKRLSIKKSRENRLLNDYFKKVDSLERKIMIFYKRKRTDKKQFMNLVKQLEDNQIEYLKASKNTLSYNFIATNQPYIPSKLETMQAYVSNKKEQYFASLNFNNKVLQASSFLTNKVVNYVLTTFPTHLSKEAKQEQQQNIQKLASHLNGVDTKFSTYLYYRLWEQLSASQFYKASDFLYHNYLKSLAIATDNTKIVKTITSYNRIRLGVIPPEITWKENGQTKTLSGLEAASHYVLVFWSSTCPHCLRELPKLHEQLKTNSKVKVLAVGLEDDESNWKRESTKLPNFVNAISMGKWGSPYAELYSIQQTPTYLVLDKDKKIVAKPDTYKEVLNFLKDTK